MLRSRQDHMTMILYVTLYQIIIKSKIELNNNSKHF